MDWNGLCHISQASDAYDFWWSDVQFGGKIEPKNDRMVSTWSPGKLINIKINKVYDTNIDAKEVKLEEFYGDLQHILEASSRKDAVGIMGD